MNKPELREGFELASRVIIKLTNFEFELIKIRSSLPNINPDFAKIIGKRLKGIKEEISKMERFLPQ